jgi:ABC-type bacteriocin/lantibiotic exporter with double-glycine peptidase domain
VQQLEEADCGAACLTTVLRGFGVDVSLGQVRAVAGGGAFGTNMRVLLEAAQGFGLRCRAIRVRPSSTPALRGGSILHWQFSHFVVFERRDRQGVHIIDPGVGRVVIPLDEFWEKFTGLALECERPEVRVAHVPPDDRLLRKYATNYLRSRRDVSLILVASVLLQLLGFVAPLAAVVLVDDVVGQRDVGLLLRVVTVTATAIGGEPSFPVDFPACPNCASPMAFYRQLDSINDKHLLPDAGLVLVFVCFDYYTTESLIQAS